MATLLQSGPAGKRRTWTGTNKKRGFPYLAPGMSGAFSVE